MKKFTVLLAFIALSYASEWHYPDLDVDMDEPFPKWGGICDSGSRQSPINLRKRDALKGDFQPLKFSNYDDEQDNLSIVNNGHSIQLSDFDHELVLHGGALLENYVVEQIHLHWWSEHTINDVRYPLEVHIVHRNTFYANMTMASNFKDGIVVIGVLYHVASHPNDAITSIINNLEEIKSYTKMNKPTKMRDALVVRDLFPVVNGYFTYAGSLTTPSCAEAVTWIVLTETFPVTLEQVEQFKEIEYDEGKQLHNNYRALQSSHNRAVVLITEETRGGGVATTALSMSMASTLLLVIIAKFLH